MTVTLLLSAVDNKGHNVKFVTFFGGLLAIVLSGRRYGCFGVDADHLAELEMSYLRRWQRIRLIFQKAR